MTILVNQSYAMQRVTGQQRYAGEIAKRLAGRETFHAVAPSGFWARSTLRVWIWVQLLLPWLAGRSTVLSMTSRAPLWRRRHVLVVHDLFVLTNPEWFSRRYVWTHAPLLRLQLRSAATVVAVSQPVADQLPSYYRGPVVVAPNAPSEAFTADVAAAGDPERVLGTLGLLPGRYLLTVGSRDPRKNLGRLAQAYSSLDPQQRADFPLVVVGGGHAAFRDEEIEWPAGVVHAGYLPDDELRVLYSRARAVVLVSQAEGFGLPLVEAAAAGTPTLVVSDIPVFRWVCGSAAHYVDPRSVAAVAAGLCAGITDPKRQDINLERFNWDESARIIGAACELVEAGR